MTARFYAYAAITLPIWLGGVARLLHLLTP